jgi:homocysteine S-methyltransferase
MVEPMNGALEAKLNKHPILLDGGLATTLEARGHDLSSDLWSAAILTEKPDEIMAVHRAFIDAGSEIITTSSYQISYLGFALAGFSHAEITQILRSSVLLAREAAVADGVLVAASVGPYGAALANGAEYRGHYGISPKALRTFHRERLKVLVGSGADLVAFETMPDLVEVEILLDLMDTDHPDTPYWVAFSCKDESCTNAGQNFAEVVRVVSNSAACVAVGLNCSSPRFVTPLLLSAAKVHGDIPFIVYPNAGKTWDASKRSWLDRGTDRFASSSVREWVTSGARLIGGCCGIGPTGIAALRQAL